MFSTSSVPCKKPTYIPDSSGHFTLIALITQAGIGTLYFYALIFSQNLPNLRIAYMQGTDTSYLKRNVTFCFFFASLVQAQSLSEEI